MTHSENTFATHKEATRTHPNQSLNSLISLNIQSSIWQFAAFPYIQAVRKAAKLWSKNFMLTTDRLIQCDRLIRCHRIQLRLYHVVRTFLELQVKCKRKSKPITFEIATYKRYKET